MFFTDTHTHLYLKTFEKDAKTLVDESLANNVKYLFLPNVDSSTIVDLLKLSDEYPEVCFPMIGVHPTSVNDTSIDKELREVKEWLNKGKFVAIGEIGIDLYWDKTYFTQQQKAFKEQVQLAIEHDLPIAIHCRESLDLTLNILLSDFDARKIKAVFHCYSGDVEQAKKIVDHGWYLGIGGVVTYKKSVLPDVVRAISIKSILLETDAPYLAPVPYRGKQNNSAFIPIIAAKIAEIKEMSLEKLADETSKNTLDFFRIIL